MFVASINQKLKDMSDKDDLIYDEDDSVAFIQNYLPRN